MVDWIGMEDCNKAFEKAWFLDRCSGEECVPFQSAFYTLLIWWVFGALVVGTTRWIIRGFRKPTRELAD